MKIFALPAAALATTASLALTAPAAGAETRDALVNADRDALADSTVWIYNDVDTAFATAHQSGKPLFVAVRCIP